MASGTASEHQRCERQKQRRHSSLPLLPWTPPIPCSCPLLHLLQRRAAFNPKAQPPHCP